ncbi:MAG: SagB/ThcOx family dehydrogenase [Desulfobacterales bacterium]|jgi:SagB-type dehydrogenase family enzyme
MVDRTAALITRYHEQTKHQTHRYARSPGHMDWNNQPNPFRFFEGASTTPLPFAAQDPPLEHMTLYRRRPARGEPFGLSGVAGFLELSLGLSAWKVYGSNRWSLRTNPSSGNLHPTEAHLVLPAMAGLAAGLYHYNPLRHALERRAAIPNALWRQITDHFATAGFLVALSSIFWREAWKYGERALRYCNHDAGHALAALSFSAALKGWKLTCLNGLSDADIETVLGFDRTAWEPFEGEHPDLVCFVHEQSRPAVSRTLPQELIRAFADLRIVGKPNRLSPNRVDWPIIYETAERCRKPRTEEARCGYGDKPFLAHPPISLTAADIIRRRRSATAFDPDGSIDRERFFALLDKSLPRDHCPPFDVELGAVAVHLLLFVHNVPPLARGLYFFCRNPEDLQALRKALRPDFRWQPVTDELPLYLLERGDVRQRAIQVSCHQEIAGFSAFSLGMIARFEQTLQLTPYRYRHLFWETGMIGQALYLEAEAQGVRGTGIGCFFDDAVHSLVGLTGSAWQSLYHFTVGCPIEDPRLTTLPPYHHLQRDGDAA